MNNCTQCDVYKHKSILRIVFLRHQNVQSELSRVCTEYQRIIELQKQVSSKEDLMFTEKQRRKCVDRIYLLNLKLGIMPCD